MITGSLLPCRPPPVRHSVLTALYKSSKPPLLLLPKQSQHRIAQFPHQHLIQQIFHGQVFNMPMYSLLYLLAQLLLWFYPMSVQNVHLLSIIPHCLSALYHRLYLLSLKFARSFSERAKGYLGLWMVSVETISRWFGAGRCERCAINKHVERC